MRKFILPLLLSSISSASAANIDTTSFDWFGGSRPNEPTQVDVLLIANSKDPLKILDQLTPPAQVILLRELAIAKALKNR